MATALRVLDGGNAGDWKRDEADVTAIDAFRVMADRGEELVKHGQYLERLGRLLIKSGAGAEFEFKALRGDAA